MFPLGYSLLLSDTTREGSKIRYQDISIENRKHSNQTRCSDGNSSKGCQ